MSQQSISGAIASEGDAPKIMNSEPVNRGAEPSGKLAMPDGKLAGGYVVISPCRDEAEFMRKTLDSMVAQEVPPALWVIVDDGSTDESPKILEDYQKKYDFIRVVTRKNRGFRSVGPGVVDAFYAGYKTIDPSQFTYICKLDLDLELPPSYFSTLIKAMENEPRMGTCSGKPYNLIDGSLVKEERGDEMSVGMTKFYRMSCFLQIGGFVREVMWDAIDSHRCRQFGWIACSWDEPAIRFTHLRVMGSSQQSIFVGRMRHGFGQFYMGTGIVYMLASCVFRLWEKPRVIGSLAVFWGYLRCYFNGSQRQSDKKLIHFIRRFQWQCLIKGKQKATLKLDESQSSEWSPSRESLPMPVNS